MESVDLTWTNLQGKIFGIGRKYCMFLNYLIK